MSDPTLERVWKARETISKRCGFDSHKLVHYYQTRKQRKSADKPTEEMVRESGSQHDRD